MSDRLHVVTTTRDGRPIEEFDATLAGASSHEIYNIAGAGVLVDWQAAYGSARPRAPHIVGDPRWYSTSADFIFQQPPTSVPTKYGAATRDVLTGLGSESPNYIVEVAAEPKTIQSIVAAHARWDASQARFTELWLAVAATLPNRDELLRARIQDQPRDIYNMRLEQDFAPPTVHAAVCARDQDLAAASPANPDLQYLAIRCLEDREEQAKQYLEQVARWPRNGWLEFGAGYVLANRGQWQEALAMYDQARRRLPGMTEQLTVVTARLTRMVNGLSAAQLRPLLDKSQLLQTVSFADVPPPNAKLGGIAPAYLMLAQGNLDQALSVSEGTPEDQARLLRLVAASDGAPGETIERALTLSPDRGLDAQTLLPTLALLARKGGDLEPYLQRASKILGEDTNAVLNAFSLVRGHAEKSVIDNALRGLPMEHHAGIYVAAAILRGNACPGEWRMAAQRLLFSTERPYLR